MKKLLFCLSLFVVLTLHAQNPTVQVTGLGSDRNTALQDAFRNAISEALGVHLRSETQVENFAVLRDAIQTRTEGYIASHRLVKENRRRDGIHEVTIQATVSLDPLAADVQLLARAIGGVRFLVMYNTAQVGDADRDLYDFAVDRLNEALARRRYRYVESKRFRELVNEADMMMQYSDRSEEAFVQQLGLRADAEFVIYIRNIQAESRSEAFDTRTGTRVTIEVRAYDNCTGEGLGSVFMQSDWVTGRDAHNTLRTTLGETIQRQTDDLLLLFNQYIGDWVNNGTPYELRFYGIGGFRDFRDLRNKLRADSNFGGQLQLTSVQNYTRINTTFRKQPDELAYQILDYADEIPVLAERVLDVKLIYGRQINFAPQNLEVPELEQLQKPE
jgi:hypothetical protein